MIKFINECIYWNKRSRDSSVGTATRYGLDGPGIESRWGARFSAPLQTVPGTLPSLLHNGYLVFPGGKAAGGVVLITHPTSKRRGHERVGLYLYSPSGLSWPLLRRTFYILE